MATKIKILCFISYYYPGYKAGGPLKTIANMVAHLSDDFEFLILTRDRDLGERDAYDGVLVNQWVAVNNAKVFYASPENLTIKFFSKLINDTEFDVLYLNSFFDPVFTLKPLVARYLGKTTKSTLVLAPRGEFSKGALNLKWLKKNIYILLVRFCQLYKNIIWQASSRHEFEDIKRAFYVDNSDIRIAPDLPEKRAVQRVVVKSDGFVPNVTSFLQIVFLSRISPMKNLDYALNLLLKVSVPVQFDIYGPKEDSSYWLQCSSLIAGLPRNVVVNYCGSVSPNEVSNVFSSYDLFLFPTRGENYGHVIVESLSVGTPVLISDQTPWRNLESDDLGWDLPLSDVDKFLSAIEFCAKLSSVERRNRRTLIVEKAKKLINNPDDIEANKALFSFVLKGN